MPRSDSDSPEPRGRANRLTGSGSPETDDAAVAPSDEVESLAGRSSDVRPFPGREVYSREELQVLEDTTPFRVRDKVMASMERSFSDLRTRLTSHLRKGHYLAPAGVDYRRGKVGQGEPAPKARQKCVVDGKQVNIPVPLFNAMGGRRRLDQPGVGYPGLSV